MAPRLTPLRRAFLGLVVSVLLVEALGIVVLKLAGIEQRSQDVRLAYTAGWMLVVVAVVAPWLRKIRKARGLGGRGGRGGRDGGTT